MLEPEDFKTEWERDAYEKASNAMSALLDVANSMGGGKAVVAGMLYGFIREHRTLQQSGIRNFVAMLKEWGSYEESHMSDLRNRDAFAFAKQVVELDPMFASI